MTTKEVARNHLLVKSTAFYGYRCVCCPFTVGVRKMRADLAAWGIAPDLYDARLC